ncbi:MAG: tetratricopeptide repeat protein [Bacteroidia bacterium]|nr:tetratricopeptide repeat protein [Bacteroidia bacterium]
MDAYQSLHYDEMFFEADALIAQGKITEAISTLEAILASDHSYGKAYNHLGWIYETKYKDYTKAEEFYKKCYAYTPEYPAVYVNLAVVLSTLGKYEELKRILEKALTVPGVEKSTVHNEFGIMHELQGEYKLAIESYKNAIRNSLNDNNVETYRKSIQRVKTKMEVLFD